MADPFIHLRTVSGYSLRHGVSTPADLVACAVELGQEALALTDRDGLYGAVRFAQACRDAGIAPILGVDIALRGAPRGLEGHRQQPQPERRRTPVRGGAAVWDPLERAVVLARGGRGWAALCRLVSAAHLSGERGRPAVSPETLVEYAADDGLLVIFGADSRIGAAAARHRYDLAVAEARWWATALGPAAVRIDLASHRARDGARTDGPDAIARRSSTLAARLWAVAREAGIAPVLTNAVRYADAAAAPVADVLDAIRRLVPIDLRHRDGANAQAYLKGWPEMRVVAREIADRAGAGAAGAQELLARTREVARLCALDPQGDIGLGDIHVPELSVLLGAPQEQPADVRSVLAGYSARRRTRQQVDQEARRAQEMLRVRCEAALHSRGADDSRARQRLADELDTIAELGFAGYFMTVAEVVDIVRGMGVRVAARGSGAGSLVNHLLGISGVDPLRHDLLMERFLSPLRRSLPDIDLDVESARRTEVYERILARFGGERCACVSMRDTYRVRHAVRDVGAALGMPPGEVDAFAKAFPHIRANQVRAALADLPEVRSSGIGRLATTGELDGFLDLVESLDGLPRHIALHPCGVLLSDATMLDRTPVEASWMGFPMSQFDKDEVESLGFLKLDVLGIRMQSAMQHAVAEVGRATGERVELDEVPMDDPATFELIRSTRTLGCFQIESPGQRELLGKFAPETFDDIIIDISLFRPGPVKSDMITPFLAARQGWQQPDFPHEDLRPALAETYGVVVYHEQVLRIVSVMTGCSFAEADEVRRSMGDPQGQEQVRGWFYRRAHESGYELATIEEVWDVLRAFASFGFCKAHAAAFALPTYQSAWLKAHHPAAFFAGVLTHDPGMYPKRLILDDARNHGVPVLPLDVNRSGAEYLVESCEEGLGIRLSLAEVKGVGGAEVATICGGQPYRDLADFWLRAGASRPTVEGLVVTGAFDGVCGLAAQGGTGRLTRRDLLLQVADLDRLHRRSRRGGGADRGRGRLPVGQASPMGAAQGGMGADTSLGPAAGAGPGVRMGPAAGAGPGVRMGPAAVRPVEAARAQSQAPVAGSDASGDAQLSLDIADAFVDTAPSGLPEMSAAERVQAEVSVLGLDTSAHIIEFHAPMLSALGVTRSSGLLACRSRQEILVAGVKVATQTPPIRSGHRVVFLTLDDGAGPVDATFFPDAQDPYAQVVFHSWLLLVRGVVRRTGPRGVSLRATGCWELSQVRRAWAAGGVDAVSELLAASPRPGDQRTAGEAGQPVPGRRVLLYASGFMKSPYADISPAGADATDGRGISRGSTTAKLWHSSSGSAGR